MISCIFGVKHALWHGLHKHYAWWKNDTESAALNTSPQILIEDHYWFWPEICWTEKFSWMRILLQKGFQPFVHDSAKIKRGEIQNICLHHLNSGFWQIIAPTIVTLSTIINALSLVLNFHNIYLLDTLGLFRLESSKFQRHKVVAL